MTEVENGVGTHLSAQHEVLVEVELDRQLQLDPPAVQLPMRRLVEAGGKRLRPQLVMLAAQLGCEYKPARAAQLAAAVELIHNSTLIHDDYVDQASVRRGRPAVAAMEGPGRAVAVGDYYFARATRMIAELNHRRVTQTIANALEVICLSQIDDVKLRGNYPGDYDSYLEVVRGKTAALIAAAARAGAELSCADEELTHRLARYGELIGIGFQMTDDLLDYQPGSGKPIGTDIRQRTLSLPLIYACQDEKLGAELQHLLSGEIDDPVVERVQQLVTASNALPRIAELAKSLTAEAVAEVDIPSLNGVRPLLIQLATVATERTV
ncbi:MAG: polyprenyl synthetase family protein [Candidatus Dormibacteraceae bacterium]